MNSYGPAGSHDVEVFQTATGRADIRYTFEAVPFAFVAQCSAPGRIPRKHQGAELRAPGITTDEDVDLNVICTPGRHDPLVQCDIEPARVGVYVEAPVTHSSVTSAFSCRLDQPPLRSTMHRVVNPMRAEADGTVASRSRSFTSRTTTRDRMLADGPVPAVSTR